MMSRQIMTQERINNYGDTYDWLFKPPEAEEDRKDPGFFNCLQAQQHQESGRFWITGKPGSGKLSLINFIYQNLQAGKAGDFVLRDWAPSKSRFVLRHFFFQSAVEPLQKSLEGYLRTMCYQIFSSDPQLQAMISQDHQAPTAVRRCLANHMVSAPWLLHDLKHCFEYLLTKLTRTKTVFIIADGLDEVVGDQECIAIYLRTLDDTFSNLKICCSSRPETHFQVIFSGDESLSLHYFNAKDMESYYHDKLSGIEAIILLNLVVDKAKGVFLWLYLVVQQPRRDIRYADQNELRQVVEECPSDMFDLFRHMLQKVDTYFKDTSTSYLALAYAHSIAQSSYLWYLQAGFSTSVFIIADKFDGELDEGILFGREVNLSLARKIMYACAFGSQQVTALGCGLIEVSDGTDSLFCSLFKEALENSDDYDELLIGQLVLAWLQQWRFIHRSVCDYLQDSHLSGNASPLFSVSDLVTRTKIFRANLAMLRILAALIPSFISSILVQGRLAERLSCSQHLLIYLEREIENLLNLGVDMSNMIMLIEVAIDTISTSLNSAASLFAVSTDSNEILGKRMLEAVYMGFWIHGGLSLRMQLRTLAARIPLLSKYVIENSLTLPPHLRSQLLLLAFAQLVANRGICGRQIEVVAGDLWKTAILYLEQIEDMRQKVCLISSTRGAIIADENVRTTIQDVILAYLLYHLCWRPVTLKASRAPARDIIRHLIDNGARDDVKLHLHLTNRMNYAYTPGRSCVDMLIANNVKACDLDIPCNYIVVVMSW